MIKNEIRYRFGDKLREIREKRGYTLKQVAHQAGVSESLVSQIERNRVSPSIDTLLNIAEVLELDVDYLFSDYRQKRNADLVRKDKRKSIIENNVKYTQLSLIAGDNDQYSIEAYEIEIKPGAEQGSVDYGHTGKELGIIIEGRGELLYGSEVYELDEGDSISFSSDIPHLLKNSSDKPLRAIWVVTPQKNMIFRK